MTSRSVEVWLKANVHQYNAAMDAAALRTAGVSKSVRSADADTVRFGKTADSTGHAIDKLSGRIRLFLEATALIGPGLIPIGAVGVPAVAGLASQFAIAALAGGSAIVAFQGVGDAVKAVSEYNLDPTVQNLEKAQEQLSRLGPDAAAFVMEFQEFVPVLREIRDASAAGWFPGLTESLDHFEDLAPKIVRLFEGIGEAGGQAVADGAESLAGERWEDFFDFLATEAPDVITDLSRIVGDLGHGAAEMWMAFNPGNQGFTDWLSDVADGFDRWASSAEGRKDIESFLAYVEETGPDVGELFASLVDMLVQVTQAAAPLGGPVLDGLTAVADVIAAIAESDIGTPIFAGLAAISLLSRATKTWGMVSQTAAGQFVSGQVKATLGARTMFSDISAMSKQYQREATKTTMVTASLFSGAPLGGGTSYTTGKGGGAVGRGLSTITSLLSNTTAEAQRTRANLGALGKTTGIVGGIAFATSGMADSLGLASTSSMALMGMMVGGAPGAVVGGLVGAVLDFKDSSKQADDILTQLRNNLRASGGDVNAYAEAVAQAREQEKAFTDSVAGDGFWSHLGESLTPGGLQNNLDVLFGGVESSAMGKLGEGVRIAEENLGDLQLALDMTARRYFDLGAGVSASSSQIAAAMQGLQPAMQALDVTAEDLMAGVKDGSITGLLNQLMGWQTHADSAAGRTEALGAAVHGLDNDMLSTADSAGVLSDALDALLDPTLDAEEALDGWRASLREMRQELDSDIGFDAFGEKAEKNREITRSYVEDSKARLVTLAGLTTTTEADMANAVAQTRDEFIKSGMAAGFSRKEIAARARELGLTPKLVRTIFEAAGIDIATLKAREARKAFLSLPKEVRSLVRTEGVPKTMAEVDALVAKYKLTEKERRALITLKDNASATARAINQLLNEAARDRVSTITVRRNTIANQVGPAYRAGGGLLSGPGTKTSDSIPVMGSNGEYMVRAAAVDHYGVDFFDRANAKRLAGGGPVGARSGPGGAAWTDIIDWPAMTAATDDFVSHIRQGSRGLLAELKVRERALEKEQQHNQAKIAMLQQESDAIKQSIKDRLAGDIFATTDPTEYKLTMPENFGEWDPAQQRAFMEQQQQINAFLNQGTGSNPIDALRASNASAAELAELIKKLEGKGLDGDALAALLRDSTIEQIREYADGPRSQVATFERLFEKNQRILDKVAGMGANAVGVTQELKEAKAEARETNRLLRGVRQELEHVKDAMKPAAREAGRALGEELNETGAVATRRR